MSPRTYFLFLWGYWSHHFSKTSLSLSGIALGVALFVTTSFNGQRSEQALLEFSEGDLGSSYEFRVSSPRGEIDLDESWMSRIYFHPDFRWIKKVSPQIHFTTEIPDVGKVMILGIDVLDGMGTLSSEPSDVFISQALADKLNRKSITYRYSGKEISIKSYGVWKGKEGYFILEDIQTLQKQLGIGRKIQSVLIFSDSVPKDAKMELESFLGNAAIVRSKQEIQSEVKAALFSFQLNLTVLSLISVLISFFMVANSMSGLFIARKKELGILRTLGASPYQTFFLFLSQSVLVGITGSILGVLLASVLVKFRFFSGENTLTSSSILLSYQRIPISLLLEGILLGSIGSILWSILPAWRASRISPMFLVRETDKVLSLPSNRFLLLGIVGSLLSLGFAFYPVESRLPWSGFLGVGGLVISFVLFLPKCIDIFARMESLIGRIGKQSAIFSRIALQELGQNPFRHAMTVSTIFLALSLILTLTMLTNSYKRSVSDWVDTFNTADFTVVNRNKSGSGPGAEIPVSLVDRIQSLDAIQKAEGYCVKTQVKSEFGMITIHAIPSPNWHSSSGQIAISNNLAYLQKLKIGDSLSIDTPLGSKNFRIQSQMRHFFSERGTVIMDLKEYQRLFQEYQYSAIRVFVKPGLENEGKSALQTLLSKYSDLEVWSPTDMKSAYTGGVDKVFRIMDSLKLTALVIALISLISALLQNLEEIKLTLSILRYEGARREQLARICRTQSMALCTLGGVFGCLLSLVLSPIILYVINQHAFGWSLTMEQPWDLYGYSVVLFPIIGAAFGEYPAFLLSKMHLRITAE